MLLHPIKTDQQNPFLLYLTITCHILPLVLTTDHAFLPQSSKTSMVNFDQLHLLIQNKLYCQNANKISHNRLWQFPAQSHLEIQCPLGLCIAQIEPFAPMALPVASHRYSALCNQTTLLSTNTAPLYTVTFVRPPRPQPGSAFLFYVNDRLRVPHRPPSPEEISL